MLARNQMELNALRGVKKEFLEAKTAKEIKDLLKIKSRQYISANIINPLINEGKLEYTNKNSINARNQKYKTKNQTIQNNKLYCFFVVHKMCTTDK